jgi:hypothetical protein
MGRRSRRRAPSPASSRLPLPARGRQAVVPCWDDGIDRCSRSRQEYSRSARRWCELESRFATAREVRKGQSCSNSARRPHRRGTSVEAERLDAIGGVAARLSPTPSTTSSWWCWGNTSSSRSCQGVDEGLGERSACGFGERAGPRRGGTSLKSAQPRFCRTSPAHARRCSHLDLNQVVARAVVGAECPTWRERCPQARGAEITLHVEPGASSCRVPRQPLLRSRQVLLEPSSSKRRRGAMAEGRLAHPPDLDRRRRRALSGHGHRHRAG